MPRGGYLNIYFSCQDDADIKKFSGLLSPKVLNLYKNIKKELIV